GARQYTRGKVGGRARPARPRGGPAVRAAERLLRLQEPVPVQEEVRSGLGRTLPRLPARGRPAAHRLRHGGRARLGRPALAPPAAMMRGPAFAAYVSAT